MTLYDSILPHIIIYSRMKYKEKKRKRQTDTEEYLVYQKTKKLYKNPSDLNTIPSCKVSVFLHHLPHIRFVVIQDEVFGISPHSIHKFSTNFGAQSTVRYFRVERKIVCKLLSFAIDDVFVCLPEFTVPARSPFLSWWCQ